MPKTIIVSSKRHFMKLINSGHTEFNLQIEGMQVAENKKTIKYNKNLGIFNIKHHLAGTTVAIRKDQLDDTFKTQIGVAINTHRLIALH